VVCKFLRKCFTDFYGEAAGIVSAVTGWGYSAAELRRAGERICTLKKLFNVREGWQPEDDWLPARLLAEPLASGVAQGTVLSAEELREMIAGYYRAREWDDTGFVPQRKLLELELGSTFIGSNDFSKSA
jgi:aldehyde:ferredoxin oxidoreductase